MSRKIAITSPLVDELASFATMMHANWSERYASLNDDELLHLAGDRRDLLEEAVVALDAEMARRGLTHKQARAKKRDALREEINEATAHRKKRNKSKYFIAQMNLRAYFLGLLGPFLLMLVSHQRITKQWAWPLVVMYLGILMACLAVQSSVRRTISFWFALAISCVPQFLLSHWLYVYHPARSSHEEKGSAFLSIFVGWALGTGVFFLLQKLKPVRIEEMAAPTP